MVRFKQTFLEILTSEIVFLLLDFNLLSCPGICNVCSVCILIIYSSTSRRTSHGDANLTHLHLNQLLRERGSLGCGARRGNHKNLMQDFRQIWASRLWFGCYFKGSSLAARIFMARILYFSSDSERRSFQNSHLQRGALFPRNTGNISLPETASVHERIIKVCVFRASQVVQYSGFNADPADIPLNYLHAALQ